MKVNKTNLYIVFDKDTKQWVFPLKSVIFIINNESDLINVRLKGKHEDLFVFDYKELENGFGTARETIEYLSDLSNN